VVPGSKGEYKYTLVQLPVRQRRQPLLRFPAARALTKKLALTASADQFMTVSGSKGMHEINCH